MVAPLAGAWIEMDGILQHTERSLVAPLAGAWIEIDHRKRCFWRYCVAPLAGAWIEIFFPHVSLSSGMSLPSRERGLKYLQQRERAGNDGGRSPRGSVD